MNHSKLISETLSHFNNQQLSETFIDQTLDESDQEKLTLKEHIENCSENWHFQSNSISCDIRHATSIEDMLEYIYYSLIKC